MTETEIESVVRAVLEHAASRLDGVSREFKDAEDKHAKHGAYDSSVECVAWRHGVERSAWLLRQPELLDGAIEAVEQRPSPAKVEP